MAKNSPYGDNTRIGAVKERTQFYNSANGNYMKRDSNTGRFMSGKSDGTKYKGVTSEK